MSESIDISIHQVRLFRALKRDSWQTGIAVSKAAGVARRTASHHLQRFTEMGIVQRADVFPGPQYRISPSAETNNHGLLRRLADAAQVFGIEPEKT